MSEPDPAVVRAAIFEVVETQLRDGTPPETKQTFDRLRAKGYSAQEAKRLIAVLVSNEIYALMKYHKPYDQTRYIAALRRLPRLPDELRSLE